MTNSQFTYVLNSLNLIPLMKSKQIMATAFLIIKQVQ